MQASAASLQKEPELQPKISPVIGQMLSRIRQRFRYGHLPCHAPDQSCKACCIKWWLTHFIGHGHAVLHWQQAVVCVRVTSTEHMCGRCSVWPWLQLRSGVSSLQGLMLLSFRARSGCYQGSARTKVPAIGSMLNSSWPAALAV